MATIPQHSLFEDEEPSTLPSKIGTSRVGPSSIRSILTPGRGSTAAYDFTLNAYRGCTFACAYCYAPSFESRSDLAATWGKWVEVKQNALDSRIGMSLKGKSIFMSSVTDPYQPVEAKLGLTRKIVERLLLDQARLVVQTRSPIVARDIDLLRQFNAARVNMSIPTESDQVRRHYEKGAPSIEARMRTVKKLKEKGISVSICISPMLPVEDAAAFAREINASGADMVTASWFHSSDRPFTATTREDGMRKNEANRWSESDYRRTRDVLAKLCPAWTSSRFAFGPAVGRRPNLE